MISPHRRYFVLALSASVLIYTGLYWRRRAIDAYQEPWWMPRDQRGQTPLPPGIPELDPRNVSGHRDTGKTRRTFIIDYERNVFLKDGKPFRYIAGAMHYFRVPKAFWEDRLLKIKATGLNAVDTFVEWSGHEPEPERFNFNGNYDIITFIKTAQKTGLHVVLRPGPYISAERDNGGLPYWLRGLSSRIKLRTSDRMYIGRVDRWLTVLLPFIKPFLYENGGPIITLQIENQYGAFWACDHVYMEHIFKVFRKHLGPRVPLLTTDNAAENNVKCGSVQGALVAVNFVPEHSVEEALSIARRANGRKGPFVVGDFYTGRPDHWGDQRVKVNRTLILNALRKILEQNASVTLYMFHGGTNFGFSNGANTHPYITSYDYGAPLSEAGNPRALYYDIRNVVFKSAASFVSLPRAPAVAPKLNYGKVKLSCGPSLVNVMGYFREREMLKTATARSPMSFEQMGQNNGYVAYTTVVAFQPRKRSRLYIPTYRDRAYVISENVSQVMDAFKYESSVEITTHKGSTLAIVVENGGRISFGNRLGEMKGILSGVTLDGKHLKQWVMEAVPVSKEKEIARVFRFILESTRQRRRQNCRVPGFYVGHFVLPKGQPPLDTFLDPTGWTKGVAFLNGFNLGRYWPVVGPQVTLYVPSSTLLPHPYENNLVLLEMERVHSSNMFVRLTDVPKMGGKSKRQNSAIK